MLRFLQYIKKVGFTRREKYKCAVTCLKKNGGGGTFISIAYFERATSGFLAPWLVIAFAHHS